MVRTALRALHMDTLTYIARGQPVDVGVEGASRCYVLELLPGRWVVEAWPRSTRSWRSDLLWRWHWAGSKAGWPVARMALRPTARVAADEATVTSL